MPPFPTRLSIVTAFLVAGQMTAATAAERIHYIVAEEVDWDYAPFGRERMMDQPFNEDQLVFIGRDDSHIGSRYRKAVYRAYTDARFETPVARTPEWAHLGVLGPVIHAEVGDTIIVEFLNRASRPYSVHPHGVFYEKSSEGTPYADGTSGADKADDIVAPGARHTYRWEVPERAGPGPSDPSSIGWLYHSHVDEPKDTNTGLIGAIVITGRGLAGPDGRPRDVDREFVTLFSVMDENVSWYLEDNLSGLTGDIDVEDDGFVESNLMHAINGYVYANISGLDMALGERVRWYAMALGTEVDIHTPHWHGLTGVMGGHRVDTVNLMPATSLVIDMLPDNPGTWMYHCHVNDHISAGMTALFHVREK